MNSKKAVYFLCTNNQKDEVAPLVLKKSLELYNLTETDIIIDEKPVLVYEDKIGDKFYYVQTDVVICEDYGRYLPLINKYFEDSDIGVMVNWHGGQNAPDKVLCIHTVGDTSTGYFSPSEPRISSNLAYSLEKHRINMGLDEFKVTTEATHWSGIVYGSTADLIKNSKVPFLDIEIGSTSESYNDLGAIEVIAKSLVEAFSVGEKRPTVLYMGGVHFEDTIRDAVFHKTHPVSLTHILASRWLENPIYMEEGGTAKLEECIDTIVGGVDAIVIHEKLKKSLKDIAREVSEKREIPLIKRKELKTPENTLLYVN